MRSVAIYGGVYFAATLWPSTVEGFAPDRRDIVGGAVTLAGAAIIVWSPRGA